MSTTQESKISNDINKININILTTSQTNPTHLEERHWVQQAPKKDDHDLRKKRWGPSYFNLLRVHPIMSSNNLVRVSLLELEPAVGGRLWVEVRLVGVVRFVEPKNCRLGEAGGGDGDENHISYNSHNLKSQYGRLEDYILVLHQYCQCLL